MHHIPVYGAGSVRSRGIGSIVALGVLLGAGGCADVPGAVEEERAGSVEQASTCLVVQNIGPFTTNVEDAQIITDPTDPTKANTNYGSTTQMIAGTSGTDYRRVVMKFDLTGGGVPSDVLITSATLSIRMLQSLGKNPIDVYAGTGLWSEGAVNWNQIAALPNAGMGALQTTIATLGVANNSVLTIPISAAIAQGWLSPATNYGILLDHPMPGRTTLGSSEAGTLGRPTLQVCYELPTCNDGIQNQGEAGLDCGGPCAPCASCFDGIQNQGEAGLDCGGPCGACATCSDGIQNQGETGLDCGGPCASCGVGCGEVLDQSQTSYSTGNVIFSGWQSFTAGQTGYLSTLTLYKNGFSGAQPITLQIYDGAGDGGALLATYTPTLANALNEYPIHFAAGTQVAVMAGHQYTFKITDPTQSFTTLIQTGNPYAGGAWGGDTAYGTYFTSQGADLWFQTSVEACGGGAGPTCADGIQNQGETGLDCGGPCAACATCADGIQNQGETGLDCGGPCAACGGACAETLDQSQTSFNSGNVIYAGWQSFTAGQTGHLSSLTLYKNGFSGTQTITLQIYDGAGDGGALLATYTPTLANTINEYPIHFAPGTQVALTAGHQYTFKITDPSQSFTTLIQTGNPYAGGAWGGDTAYGTYFTAQGADLWFQTSVDACATCSDGIQNQDETGIDCGGSCAPCPVACGELLDQSQTSFNSGNLVYSGWQSFTAAQTGYLSTLTIYKNGLSGTQTITLQIYDGAGDGGALLATYTPTLANTTNEYPIHFASGTRVAVTAGHQYTFKMTDPSQSFTTLLQTGNPYAGGAWGGDTAYGTYFTAQGADLWFQTSVDSCR